MGSSSPRPLTLCHQLPFLLGVDSVCTRVPASYISPQTKRKKTKDKKIKGKKEKKTNRQKEKKNKKTVCAPEYQHHIYPPRQKKIEKDNRQKGKRQQEKKKKRTKVQKEKKTQRQCVFPSTSIIHIHPDKKGKDNKKKR